MPSLMQFKEMIQGARAEASPRLAGPASTAPTCTGAPPSGASTSGAARKARERKARSEAKKVKWLATCFQLAAVHHTSPDPVAALRSELADLRRQLADLRARVVSEPEGAAMVSSAQRTEEAFTPHLSPQEAARVDQRRAVGPLGQAAAPVSQCPGSEPGIADGLSLKGGGDQVFGRGAELCSGPHGVQRQSAGSHTTGLHSGRAQAPAAEAACQADRPELLHKPQVIDIPAKLSKVQREISVLMAAVQVPTSAEKGQLQRLFHLEDSLKDSLRGSAGTKGELSGSPSGRWRGETSGPWC